MLSDSNITKEFTMSRQKVLYIVSDRLGPLLWNKLYNDITSSEETFTEFKTFVWWISGSTRQKMNVLICYWNKIERLTVTQYLMSFFF